MTKGLRDLLVGDWWRYSVSLLGTVLLAVGISSVLIDRQITGDELVQLSGLVVLCLLLIALGARIAVEIKAGDNHARILGWTSFGIVATAALGGWTAAIVRQTVDSQFGVALVFLSVLAAGALFGTVVGYYEVRVRRLVERASRESARREFLDEQQETLSSLNRIFRHQILNDLSAISGRSELLAAEKIGPEKATDSITEHCEHMEETVDRLEAVIDVLTHVRTPTDVSVAEEIEDARERARERYPDLSIETEGATETTVAADELLSRALAELLTNAGEHGGGAATVSVREEGESVVIAVADDGPGIDVSPVDSVFDPNTRGPASDGDGLGLFLAELIVDRYDGAIRIAEADDGTTVELVIPTERPESVAELDVDTEH
jgi:signal transduction histidine kinase